MFVLSLTEDRKILPTEYVLFMFTPTLSPSTVAARLCVFRCLWMEQGNELEWRNKSAQYRIYQCWVSLKSFQTLLSFSRPQGVRVWCCLEILQEKTVMQYKMFRMYSRFCLSEQFTFSLRSPFIFVCFYFYSCFVISQRSSEIEL